MLLAATITGAHGIQGWVKVHTLTDSPENFLSFGQWTLRRPDGQEERICFSTGRRQGKGLIAKIEGVDTRDAAEMLRGAEIRVADDALPTLEAGDYYWRELQDLRVYTEHEGKSLLLGEVDHLIETGANDVLVLRPCLESFDKRERLIPYLPGDVVLEVSREKGLIRVTWHPED